MAATMGRLTGRIGVCLATLGPGATNFVTAAAYAQLGAMPMMMITGQKPIKASKQGRFQIVDVVAMMRPITKFAKQIVNGNTIPSVVREAFRLAQEERPGAVHIELPEDIAAETVAEQPLYPPTSPRRPDCGEKAIDEAVAMIRAAKHPLLLVGAGANRKRIIDALETFVGKTGIPYFNTQMGKGVIGRFHDLYIGTAALSVIEIERKGHSMTGQVTRLGPDRSLLYVWVDAGNTGLTGQELATDVVELVCDELGVKYELVNY